MNAREELVERLALTRRESLGGMSVEPVAVKRGIVTYSDLVHDLPD